MKWGNYMIKVTLRIAEGTNKDYVQEFISGRMFRRTIAMQTILKGEVTEETLDSLVSFVVDLFEKQFTTDQFYDGVASDKLIEVIVNCISGVTSGVSKSNDSTDPN